MPLSVAKVRRRGGGGDRKGVKNPIADHPLRNCRRLGLSRRHQNFLLLKKPLIRLSLGVAPAQLVNQRLHRILMTFLLRFVRLEMEEYSPCISRNGQPALTPETMATTANAVDRRKATAKRRLLLLLKARMIGSRGTKLKEGASSSSQGCAVEKCGLFKTREAPRALFFWLQGGERERSVLSVSVLSVSVHSADVFFSRPEASLLDPRTRKSDEVMPRRRRRSAPRLLLALSLLIATGAAFFLSSCPCAQGNAEQSPAKRAEPLPTTSTPTASSLSSSSIFVADDPDDDNPDLPTVSASGYVPNGGPDRGGGQLFFAYYEKKNKNGTSANENDPIFLWLEGGPGCASTFGALYINGPDRVLASRDAEGGKRRTTGKLRNNSHAWNAVGGMLYVDQPVGTGLSVPGEGGEGGSIPRTEVEVAADLYFGLCELFGAGGPLQALASRPFFITGESYAGKFVPSIAHYILQAEQEAGTKRGGRTRTPAAGVASSLRLQVRRELRRESGGLPPRPPPFHLAGIAVVSCILLFVVVSFCGESGK